MVQKCSPRTQINEDTLTKVGHWSLDVVGDLLFTDTSYMFLRMPYRRLPWSLCCCKMVALYQ